MFSYFSDGQFPSFAGFGRKNEPFGRIVKKISRKNSPFVRINKEVGRIDHSERDPCSVFPGILTDFLSILTGRINILTTFSVILTNQLIILTESENILTNPFLQQRKEAFESPHHRTFRTASHPLFHIHCVGN